MSTAIAEAPVEAKTAESVKTAEVKTDAKTDVKVETPPPAKSELITSLLRPNVQVKDPKTGAVVAETGKKADVVEAKVETKTQEHNFAELRKAREAAEALATERETAIKAKEAELLALRTEYDTFKKSAPVDLTEKLTAVEKRAQELDAELRVSNLARHPDFVKKYHDGIKQQVDGMAGLLKAAGVEAKEIQEALGRWDTAKLAEWHDGMDAATRIRFQNLWGRAEELDNQRVAELQQADQTWEEITNQQKAQMEKQNTDYFEGLRREKGVIITELESAQEIVKNDPVLRAELETLIDRAARLNGEPMPPAQILRHLANAHVLARHFQRVENEKGVLAEKLAGVEKTLAERDAFIAKLSGSSPVPGLGTGTAASVDDKKALVNKLIRPTVSVG